MVTNGYNSGIVQLVGQAITKMKLTNQAKNLAAIGVCKWGSVLKPLAQNIPEHNGRARVRMRLCISTTLREP